MAGRMNRLLAVLISAVTVTSSVNFSPMGTKAAEDTYNVNDAVEASAKNENSGALLHSFEAPLVGNSGNISRYVANSAIFYGLARSTAIPSSYSSVDRGYVTSVKNQGGLGICWAYGACAAMESYALSHGYVSSPDDIDLSEFGLAYMTFNDSTFTDPLGGTTGDKSTNYNMTYSFANGGNDQYAFKTLSKWAGIVNQDKAPVASYPYQLDKENTKYTFNPDDVSYILTGQKYINMKERDLVKQAIIENGAVSTIYTTNQQQYPDKYVYYSVPTGSGHEVAIVGWNDTIDKSKFATNGYETPPGNGAWLIKNSWGNSAGDNGYFWMSYYESSIQNMNAVIYEIVPADTYDYNYQYDGSTIFNHFIQNNASFYKNEKKFANIFKVNGSADEILRSVAFAVGNSNLSYTIDIYKVDTTASTITPENGTLLTSYTGKTTYAGYYTSELPESITLHSGDTFSVVVTFDKVAGINYSISEYRTADDKYTYWDVVNRTAPEHSYLYYYNRWVDINAISYDMYPDADFCIKAFTTAKTDIEASEITGIEQTDIDKALITWKKTSDSTGYALYRKAEGDTEYSLIYNGTDSEYTDDGLLYGMTYYYYVKAYNESHEADTISPSGIKKIIIDVPKTRITDIKSVGNGISLTWDKINSATEYKVLRSADGENYTVITSTVNNEYTDCKVPKYNTTYYYAVVTVVNNGSDSLESVRSIASTGQKKVNSPTNGKINDEEYQTIKITWSKVDNASGYYIKRKVTGKDTVTIDVGNTDSYTDYVESLGLDEKDQIVYQLYSYVTEDGYKKEGKGIEFNALYLRYPAITGLTYEKTDNNGIRIKWDAYAFPDNKYMNGRYYVYIADAASGVYQKYATYRNYFDLPQYDSNKAYYVKVTAAATPKLGATIERELTAVQTPVLTIGEVIVKPDKPILSAIGDKNIEIGSRVEFDATVTNKDPAVEYTYQWYEAASKTSSGTRITNATSAKYVPVTSKNGEKYYYCVVTAARSGYTETTTTNRAKVRITTPVSHLTVSSIAAQTYTGKELTPSVTVKYDSTTLKNGTDYTITYSNNINPGTATVTITGKGYYTGTRKINFTINKPAVKPPTQATSSKVRINQSEATVKNVKVGTSVSSLLQGINEKQYCVIRKNNVNQSQSTAVGTGMQLCVINNNKVVKSYNIIVTGDTNGDSKVNITDLIAVKQSILGKASLSNIQKMAGDMNGDGKINITDFIKIKAKILGRE